jgi:tetratricopeptide (TPR) repeat protein
MNRLSLRTAATLSAFGCLVFLSGCHSMNGYVMNASGQGYYEQGNYAMAAQEFQTALASSPKNPDYMANLAKSRLKMGDATGAEQLYRQALTTSPSHQPSYHGYSELMLAQGRNQEAMRMLNTWAATQPYIAESHVELAWLQRELGQHDAAAASLQTALQANPNHATALAHLGQHYHDTGQPDQAIAMYQRSLQANWNQPEVQSKLAAAASTVGAGHPMGEIAMARGVHPQDIPRQQLAWGQPNPPMAMAQMPMPAQQAMNPLPTFGQPQMAYQPQLNGLPTQQAYQQFNQTPTYNHMAEMPVQSMSPMLGMTPVFGGGSDVTMLNPASTSTNMINPVPTASGPTPTPMPDPAFSEASSSSIPATSVSQSTEVKDQIPEVEAF